MQTFSFSVIFILIFGLISCNSENTLTNKSKVILHQDNFSVNPPRVIQLESQNSLNWKNLQTHSTPLKIFDSLEVDTSLVSHIKIDSLCSQNGIQYHQVISLNTKPLFAIYEILPLELVKKFENTMISCNFEIIFSNQYQSTHSYKIKSMLINPQDWPHNYYLTSSIAGTPIELLADKSRPSFHATALSSLSLRSLSESSQHNSLHLICQDMKDFSLQHPYPEMSLIDWKKWIQKLRLLKTQKLKISCRFMTFENHTLSGWTPTFDIYTSEKPIPIKNLHMKLIGDSRQKPINIEISISNPLPHPLYIKINKLHLQKSFSILDGFHLLKSSLISESDYSTKRILDFKFMSAQKNTTYTSPLFMWSSSKQVHSPEIKSLEKDIKAHKEDSKHVFFKINKKSTGKLNITFKRNKNCKNIFVDYSEFIFSSPFQIDFLADLTNASLINPLDRIEATGLNDIKLTNEVTSNQKMSVRFQAQYPELMNLQNRKDHNNIIQSMKKNYLPNFNCSADSLSIY